jgi:hypothetical protein
MCVDTYVTRSRRHTDQQPAAMPESISTETNTDMMHTDPMHTAHSHDRVHLRRLPTSRRQFPIRDQAKYSVTVLGAGGTLGEAPACATTGCCCCTVQVRHSRCRPGCEWCCRCCDCRDSGSVSWTTFSWQSKSRNKAQRLYFSPL